MLGVRLNSDDYQYIASMAPIHSIGDVFRPFVSHDANPSFFRPLANMTMAADFLLFGWSGMAFHLTNIFFHLATTVLVFYFVRDIFDLSEKEAFWSALIFGLAASHEYNLAVDTGRADILVAIFVMLTLLNQKRASRGVLFQAAALLSFALALCSKEIAIVVVPMVFLLAMPWDQWYIIRRTRTVLPYLALSILFYFYHAHFTHSELGSQPLSAEGSRSIVAMLRNGAYALGYTVFPLDLEIATTILTRYWIPTVLCGGIIAALVIWAFARTVDRHFLLSVWKPLLFSLFTGSILLLTFERWRVYLPSVGVISVIVLMVSRTSSKVVQRSLIVLSVAVGIFQVSRGLTAQSEWRASTALRDDLKTDLAHILASIPERPLKLGFIASPSKLGSAAVIQVGQSALVERVEADRISSANHRDGTTTGVQVDSWTAVEAYALDRAQGFRDLRVAQIGEHFFQVLVPDSTAIRLYPSGESLNGKARRDLSWSVGDSVVTPDFVDIVRRVVSGGIKAIEIHIRDTNARPVIFDNSQHFKIATNSLLP